MREKKISLPVHIRAGIKHRKAGFSSEYRLFSGDCESVGGHPLTIQLTDNADSCDLMWVDQKTILPTFMKWMKGRLLRHRVNVCFFHNLGYDLTCLLYDHLNELSSSCVTLDLHGAKWEILSGKVYYAKVKYNDGTVLHIIDSFRFFTGSLDKIGKDLGCRNKKGPKPAGLGKKRFTPADTDFIEYSKSDAMLGYELGEAIIAMHEEYDVALSMSAPQFAMRVFTKYHLKEDEEINLPSKWILNGALASYHGGKNGFYVKPGLYRDVTELDISSAYPHAMKSMPQFVRGFYKKVFAFEAGLQGIYCVTGEVKRCRYAIFQTHDGKAIHGGPVKNLWVTSYELAEAIRAGEIRIDALFGWLWVPDPAYTHNPLADYVDEFYAKKQASHKGDPKYLTYKLLLNSLYGKFIQNVEVEENGKVNAEFVREQDGRLTRVPKTFKAGGMFSPVIASLITGFVRAYLHRMEHDYKAIHSSTDSIKTMEKIDEQALPGGLGGLNVEVRGDCILLRNKLYLHYDGAMGQTFVDTDGVTKKRPPKKYALHGFWGKVDDLLALVAARAIKYTITHLYKMKEAQKQGKVPLKSYTQKREVNIDWSSYIEQPRMGAEAPTGKDRPQFVQAEIWVPTESLHGLGGSQDGARQI